MVLVTGGAQGLGASIVLKLVQNNYDVIIGYNTNENKALRLCDFVVNNYCACNSLQVF